MRFIQLGQALEKGVGKIYLVEGEDGFLRGRTVEKITEKIGLAYPELNSVVIPAEENWETIFAACAVMPFMSGKRLVRVYDKPVNSDAAKALNDFVPKSGENYCLVVVNSAKTQVRSLSEDIVRVDCDRLDAENVAKWIDVDARRNGLKISVKNALTVAERCGCDMSAVRNEMNKLVNYSTGEITAEDISECVTAEPEYSVFKLTDAISRKDTGEALTLLSKLVKAPEDYTATVALVYGNFRRMFYAKNSATTDEETAAALSVKPAAVRIAKEKAADFGAKKLMKAMELCAAADEAMKTSSVGKGDILELLVLQLCNL